MKLRAPSSRLCDALPVRTAGVLVATASGRETGRVASPRADPPNAYRLLPSIDEALRDPALAAGAKRVPRELFARFVAQALEELRAEIKSGRLDALALEKHLAAGALAKAVEARILREDGAGLRRCVNATGVVLNTGLGRAPVHPEVAEAMAEAARSYCVLEVDRWTNERNQRDDRLAELLARMFGVESAIVVNNNAGAVLLLFQTFAGGKEAIVSRGELVEIGGSFRVPSVMERANAQLVEVGTTNRTRIADYAGAIGPNTGLLVKVHTSNFRVEGFTEEVGAAELAALGRERGVTSAFDLGSGLVEGSGMCSIEELLGGEPLVRAAVASGVDVVTFSGDKLLGAPQAGILVGARSAIAALRKNPIYRALRLDKVGIAGLEKTLELVLAGRGDEIPVRRMLRASAAELEPRAKAIAQRIAAIPGLDAAVVPGASQPGSGSAPGVTLPTFCVRVVHAKLSAGGLATALRAAQVPVFGRVQEGALLLDPRTLLPGDEEDLLAAFVPVSGAD
ncbi:MAG: L-seryl-tRNA(Sec) selenium transferase [Planctomycetes bacterium]|nr:L-seryl-tRNA(Sec) selenium transferase [Planctomycetota bacterium]